MEKILQYTTIYNISSDGIITNKKTGRVLKTTLINGYKTVSLSLNGKYSTYKIHRLVAILYLTNPFNYKYVNHIDGNKLNNCISNLEWCTAKHNINHAFRLNLIKTSKIIYQYDMNGSFICSHQSILKASYATNTPASNISACCNGKRKQANNYKWSFA